jgi:hypothetical protein
MESFHAVVESDASKFAFVGMRIVCIKVTVENIDERF